MSTNKSGSAENNAKPTATAANKEFTPPVISSSPSESNNEISALRSDVDQLSNEVQTAVVDLKKSISDIRSSVSEMENPFNLLRSVQNGPEAGDETKLPQGVKSIPLGKPEQQPPKPQPQIEPEPEFEPEPMEKPAKNLFPLPKAAKASAYIDWIWDLMDNGLTAENVRQLANSCELMNYLPPQASSLIYSLAITAEKVRSLGLGKGHLLLFMYKAAAISKTTIDPQDMEALIDITEQQMPKPEKARGTE